MSKITDEKFHSRQEAAFVEIMDRIQTQNEDLGAIFFEATGMQGVAKTAILLAFLDDTILNHPDQKNFWRNPYNAPFQFTKLEPGYWEIFLEENSSITFHDRDTEELEEVKLPFRTFTDFMDLYKKAIPGCCTVVFFEDETKWYDFIAFLNRIGAWTHVYLDEYGELFPAQPSGKLHKMLAGASNILKEVRKCKTNVYATTQVASDVDYRVRGKIMTRAYLFGARPDKRGRVNQEAIDALERNLKKGNEAWLEEGFGLFGKGRFTKIYKPRPGMNWEAHKPDESPKISDYLKSDRRAGRPNKTVME